VIGAALLLVGQTFLSAHLAQTRMSAPHDKTVSLDVKNEDVHVILKSMQKQCDIRNLIIDPKVAGEGTFVFHSLPCRAAFDHVARTMSLRIDEYENNVVAISPDAR